MLKDLVIRNRSYRSFDMSRRITREELLDMVDCARLTPSAINYQPLKYRLCTDEEECKNVLACTAWAGLLKNVKLPPVGHEPTAYIVVCLDTDIQSNETAAFRDVGIVDQTIMLKAAEMGFGGCIIGCFGVNKLINLFSLPANIKPIQVLALGIPDESVTLTDLENGDNSVYYRDGENHHYVPKRKLEDIIL